MNTLTVCMLTADAKGNYTAWKLDTRKLSPRRELMKKIQEAKISDLLEKEIALKELYLSLLHQIAFQIGNIVARSTA